MDNDPESMTSIAVKLEQRIRDLKKQKSEEPVHKINYMEHYLNFVIVRSTGRGVFSLISQLMVRKDGEIGDKAQMLQIALYTFAGISLYFSIHGLCCFDELKVRTVQTASYMAKRRNEVLDPC